MKTETKIAVLFLLKESQKIKDDKKQVEYYFSWGLNSFSWF